MIHLLAPKDKYKWNPIWHKCYEIWNNSPYTIKLWDDITLNELLKSDDEDFYNNYLNKCPNIYKWDYARYVILEKHGGAYFDMDVEIIDGSFFQKLKSSKLYLYGAYASSGVEPVIMIETEGFEKLFWFLLKQFIQKRIIDNKPNTIKNVIWKTGPLALTSFYLMWIKDNMVNVNNGNNIQILPWELFGQSDNDLRYCTHHYTKTWR